MNATDWIRKECERLDEVNDSIRLIQNTEGLTFGTDALLLAAFVSSEARRAKRALEIGSGTGIISLLLLARGRVEKVTCVEVQPEYAELTERNIRLNGLEERAISVCRDIRDFSVADSEDGREFDLVFSNPPYMKTGAGKTCKHEGKEIARHEVCGSIDDFLESAARLVRFGGLFAAVYRPDRLCDLLFAMRKSGIEPKRLTFAAADFETEPSSVLVLGKRGGKSGLTVTPTLYLYRSATERKNSEDLQYILDHGRFPARFGRKGAAI